MKYWPNPSHKVETTVAGPPVWNPDKAKCPRMSMMECQELLKKSRPHGGNSRRRWTVQKVDQQYIFYALMTGNTQYEKGNLRYHGYPDVKIPPRVRRELLTQEAESESSESNFI